MLLPLVHAPELTASFRRYLLILGIVHTGIMYQLLYSAIQKLPTPVTGSLSFIYPLVAMVVDYLVFHHALSAVQLLGGMLILFAAAGNNLGWGENPAAAGSVSSRGPVSDGRGQSGICASGIRPARSRYEPDGRTEQQEQGHAQHRERGK